MKNPYKELHVNYHGLFLSPMSWAQVNRETVLAMDRLGCKVSVNANRGFCYQPDFPVPVRIAKLRKEPLGSQWDVAFEYPMNYERLKAGRKAGLLVYESSKLPAHWVEEIRKHLDLLVVPSTFCREAAVQSGVPGERILVIPYGVDPSKYHPLPEAFSGSASSEKKFTFLCLAMPHRRKGLPELLQAFEQEFSAREPVRLVVKLPYLPGNRRNRKPWELESLGRAAVNGSMSSGKENRIHLFHGPSEPEQMPVWFALCDAYVQPSYGEGFGLSILEAKAAGKPTVVTGWGGHMDFCNEENSYLVDYELIPAGTAQYDSSEPDALFARPCVDSLRRQMRRVYQHPREAGRKADRSRHDVHHLTWETSARKLLDALLERM